MAAFQRLAHQLHVADAFETIIRAAAGKGHQVRDEIALHLFRIHEMGHCRIFSARALRPGFKSTPMILSALNEACALDDVEADAAQTEHHHIGSRLYFGFVWVTAPIPVVTPQPM